MNIFMVAALSTISLLDAPSQEVPSKLLDDAKAIVFSSCLQNKGRSISECDCYGKGLESNLDKSEYHFFMEALYYSNNRDKLGFDKVMVKYGKKLEDLDNMSIKIADIGPKIEEQCKIDSSE